MVVVVVVLVPVVVVVVLPAVVVVPVVCRHHRRVGFDCWVVEFVVSGLPAVVLVRTFVVCRGLVLQELQELLGLVVQQGSPCGSAPWRT